jgi:hypothetical protein
MMRCGIRSIGLFARVEFGDCDAAFAFGLVAKGDIIAIGTALECEAAVDVVVPAPLEEVICGCCGVPVVTVTTAAVAVLDTIVVTLLQVSLMAFSRTRRVSASIASSSAMTRSTEPVR